jgi:hypothetical protein
MLCVKSFLYLAEDESFRRQIVDGAALSHLLNVSTSNNTVEMCQVTAKTLRLLCGDRNVAHKLVENGIGHALITLLGCEDNLIQQFCAEALCGLFQLHDILVELVEQGAAQELVNLTHHTSNPHTCEWCSFALYQLAKGTTAAGKTHILTTSLILLILIILILLILLILILILLTLILLLILLSYTQHIVVMSPYYHASYTYASWTTTNMASNNMFFFYGLSYYYY